MLAGLAGAQMADHDTSVRREARCVVIKAEACGTNSYGLCKKTCERIWDTAEPWEAEAATPA